MRPRASARVVSPRMHGRPEGVVVDAVLGLSVTPSAVGLVLVEGPDIDGTTVDREAFEITPGRHANPQQVCEQAAAAVLQTEEAAVARGQRLHSIGVTWSDDADGVGALLIRSLTECGFDSVMPIRLSEATEALAWGVAEVIGYDITAVCVLEPEAVMALVVHTRQGAVQTAVNHTIDTEQALIRWLSAVFTRADWRPEALVLVGSGADLDALMPRLEDALSVPVFAPAESEVALARGAALASAHRHGELTVNAEVGHPGHQRRPMSATGPLAMLAAGAVTFVVSVSIALGLELNPARDEPADPSPAAKSSPEAAAAGNPRPAVAPAPVAKTPRVAPPPAPPVEVAPPPPDRLRAEPPADVAQAPQAPPEGPPEAPVVPIEAGPPAASPPPQNPPSGSAAFDALPPESRAPGLVPVEPTPVPEERPGILRRIKDRLSRIGQDDDVPDAVQPPAVAAVPGPPEAPMPPPEAAAPPPEVPPPPPEPPPPPPPEAPPPPPPEAPPPPPEPPLPPPA